MVDNNKSYTKELLKLQNKNLIACGFQKLSVGASAVGLTVPDGATYALIVVESAVTTAAIRYLELGDKVLPTSSDGIPRSNLDAFDVQGAENLTKFRVIQTTGAGTLQIQYYK